MLVITILHIFRRWKFFGKKPEYEYYSPQKTTSLKNNRLNYSKIFQN